LGHVKKLNGGKLMKIQGNETVQNTIMINVGQKDNSDKKSDKFSGTINFNTLNLADDKVEQKRKQARRIAMKLASDVFASDNKIDSDLEERRQKIASLEDENKEYTDNIVKLQDKKQELKEAYEVDDDSEEQKNLDLLEKARQAQNDPLKTQLTEEEQQKVSEIYKQGLTDYQKDVLSINDSIDINKDKIVENEKGIIEEYAIIRGVKLDRLKSHDMVDAQKQGDEIVAAANKEIIGMLMEDVKDTQDEKLEEQEEKAEERKEEKEEQEERIEAAKEEKEKYQKDDDMDNLYEVGMTLDDIRSQSDSALPDDIKKTLSQVVAELQLSAEDLKGLIVDNDV
jgi:hypothetical protein